MNIREQIEAACDSVSEQESKRAYEVIRTSETEGYYGIHQVWGLQADKGQEAELIAAFMKHLTIMIEALRDQMEHVMVIWRMYPILEPDNDFADAQEHIKLMIRGHFGRKGTFVSDEDFSGNPFHIDHPFKVECPLLKPELEPITKLVDLPS